LAALRAVPLSDTTEPVMPLASLSQLPSIGDQPSAPPVISRTTKTSSASLSTVQSQVRSSASAWLSMMALAPASLNEICQKLTLRTSSRTFA
jgi:hypothetical protein